MFEIDYRIPIIDRHQIAGPHNIIPVDSDDPRFSEPLVKLESYGVAFNSYHAITDGNNPPYGRPIGGSRQEGWIRKSVAERLARVNGHLEPYGAELIVLDAYRSMECQQGLWNFFYEQGREKHPGADNQVLTEYALGFVRDPRLFDKEDSATFPAHATGASVDVTIRDIKTRKLLNMGSRFEEIIDVSYTDYFERQLNNGLIEADDERLLNRRMMDWAFTRENFLNDPILYWHYDWGNQLYIKVKRAISDDAPAAAWYGYIAPPQWEFGDTHNLST